MTALTEAFVKVSPDMNTFEGDTKKGLRKVDVTKEGVAVGNKFGKGFGSAVGSAAKRTAGVMAGAFAAVGAGRFLKGSITAASDLGETTSKVGQIFGASSKQIEAFASTANTKLGQTKQAALDANATFGLFGKSAGLSGTKLVGFTTSLTTLAGDLASFNNTSPEQAIEAIGAALRGESEPIRAYGVLLDDATLKAEAMRMGLVKASGDTGKVAAAQLRAEVAQKRYNAAVKEHGKNSTEAKAAQAGLLSAQNTLKNSTQGTIGPLTQQQRVLAAQSVIMKQTSTAQGDFQRTSAGLANQQRIAAAQFNTLKIAIGNALLPAVTLAAHAFNEQLMPPLIDLAEKHGPALGAALSDIATKAGPFVKDFLQKAGPFLKSLADGSNEASPALASMSDSIAQLGPLLKQLLDSLPSLTDALNVGATVLKFFADHADLLAKSMPVLVAAILAYKAAQLAANVAALANIPVKVAEVVVNRQLVKSNKELIASRAAAVATTGAETVATAANTTAKSTNAVTSLRQRAATLAVAAAQKIAAVASTVLTGAMKALRFAVALAMGPVGLIILGLAAVAAGLIYAYRHSETFRNVVNAVFKAVAGAASAAFKAVIGFVKGAIDWIKKNWPLLVAILTGPIGLAIYVIKRYWADLKTATQSALRWIVDKFLDFAGDILGAAAHMLSWVPGVGGKLKAAQTAFGKFRDDVNTKLGGIKDQEVKVTADLKSWGTPELLAAAHGRAMGGPGGPIHGPGTTTSDQAGLYALSNKEWVIRAAAAGKYGDAAMSSVNDGTATIIPGMARGGRAGVHVQTQLPSERQQRIAANNVAVAVRTIGREMGPVMAKIMAKATGYSANLVGVLKFVKSQVGKPYVWGGVGPGGYDCSGLISAAVNVARGKRPYSRLGATGSMPWPGMVAGPGAFEIGWFTGNPGHTAGTVNGVNIESAGGVGVRMGSKARGARNRLFNHLAHLKGFAKGGRAKDGDLPYDVVDPRGKNFMGKELLRQLGISDFDNGGRWRPGTLGANLSSRTETVVAGNEVMTVRWSDEDRKLMRAIANRPIAVDGRQFDQAVSRIALGGGY